MTNKAYVKGRNKEYKIVKELKDRGFDIVQRTAGSHSPIDIIAIDKITKVIRLIQAKPEGFNSKKLEDEFRWLNGMFRVEFYVE